MAFRTGSDDSSPMSEINITPLVDVMLVLLVIFMVAAPMMENGIPIQVPQTVAKNNLNKGENPVTLHLSKDSKVFLDKDEIPFDRLGGYLENFFKSREKKEVFIRADGALPYSFVAQTMAIVKQAGIPKIGLITSPSEK